MKKTLSGMLSISLLLASFGTACGKKIKEVRKPIEITESYSCVPFQAPAKDGFKANLVNVLPDETDFCISVLYTDGKNNISHTDIMTVSEKGEIESILELSGIQVPTAVFPTEYAFLGVSNTELLNDTAPSQLDRVAVFLDKKTGNVTKTVIPDFQAEYIAPTSDGFVIVGRKEIAKYDQSGEYRKTVKTSFPVTKNSFFEDKGKYYVVCEDEEEGFYSVDFSSETVAEVASFRELEMMNADVSGKYAFRAQGVYIVDLESRNLVQSIAWNNVDIRPPTKGLIEKQYYPVNDRQFALKYTYGETDSELLLFSRDENYKPVMKEKITIGGCLVYQDLPLQWLVYKFNTSNSDYRAVLDEYARFYVGNDANDLRRGQLSLMQYFSDGNTPDIFYGNTFEFEYMGRTGMVSDLKPYLDKSEDNLELLTDAAKNLMVNGNDACYQVFASYWLNGNVGLTRHFPEGSSISIRDLYKKSQDMGIPEYDRYSANAAGIVGGSILYDFPKLWGVYDKDKKISVEELNGILDMAISVQNAYGSGNDDVMYQDSLKNDLALIDSGIIGDIYGFAERENELRDRITFIGNPAIDGSIHVAMPSCRLAMSTTSPHPDKCWELISGIFSEEVQKVAACSGAGEIPVNKNVLNEICEAAMDPKSVSDEVVKSFVGNNPAVSQENVDDYLQAISTADALYTENRRLMFIVNDEVNSYYTQNRTTDQIAKTLYDRLELYAQENYS